MTWQAWRSLVTPWVVWHRRHSSWHLWGSHILLLYILSYLLTFPTGECNSMCNQLWSNHTYSINLLFSYIPLFFIIFIIFIFISIIIILILLCERWYTFSCDTTLMQRSVFSFISFNIFVTCVVSFLWGPQTVWFVILHLKCSTQNFSGVCVTQSMFGWYLGHLESPITLGTHLVLMWIFHIFICQTSNYSSLILSYISIAFSAESPASVYGISAVFTWIIIVLM